MGGMYWLDDWKFICFWNVFNVDMKRYFVGRGIFCMDFLLVVVMYCVIVVDIEMYYLDICRKGILGG